MQKPHPDKLCQDAVFAKTQSVLLSPFILFDLLRSAEGR